MGQFGDLNFKRVDTVNKTKLTAAVEAEAIIRVHNELPKNEQGVATVTLRQLISKFGPSIDGLLREYVCAFGAHGSQVIARFVDLQCDGNAEELASLRSWFETEVSKKQGQIAGELGSAFN